MTKQGIRGFATGMILTTIAITTVYSFSSENPGKNTGENIDVTQEMVESYIEETNSVMITEERYNTLLTLEEQANEEQATPDDIENNEEEAPEVDVPEPEGQQEEPAEVEDSAENDDVAYYTLTVRKGMNSIQVADILGANNIVDSADAFEQYLVNNNLNRSVQIGEFTLNSNMSYQELGRILTKR